MGSVIERLTEKAPMEQSAFQRLSKHVVAPRPDFNQKNEKGKRYDGTAPVGRKPTTTASAKRDVAELKGSREIDPNQTQRQIFVGGVTGAITKKELSWAFSYFGRVTHIRIMSRPDGSARGFAFIKYKCAKSAEAAVQKGYLTVGGVTTEIRYCISVNESEKYKDIKLKSKVFIGSLNKGFSEEDLLKYLSQFGEVVEFIRAYDSVTGRRKGYGFATFAEQSSVDRFLSKKGGHQIKGTKLTVGHAEEKKSGQESSTSGNGLKADYCFFHINLMK